MSSIQRSPIREVLRIGPNRYDVSAAPVDEFDYEGAWRCALCKRGDSSATTHRRPSTALEWARNCVAVHHAATHADE